MLWMWHFVMKPFQSIPPREAFQCLQERYDALLEQDIRNVEDGYYPRELLFQFPLLRYLRTFREGFWDIPRVVLRRYIGNYGDIPKNRGLEHYPGYYRRTFHWQTDGWLSEHSARVYDPGVEFLFLGTADVMRRMVIPPVADAVRSVRKPRILDVACGTGRFLLQLHKALPGAKLYGLDLSPYYIRYAADVLSEAADVSLVTDNAENMPLGNGTFDAVTCIFLFHELPKDARRRVMREVYRVLKPGGIFVILDSAQFSESKLLKEYLVAFQSIYHEPYYKAYLRDDLEGMMEECGFTVDESEPHFVSKRVVGRKAPQKLRRRN